jgi:hypothetical protein
MEANKPADTALTSALTMAAFPNILVAEAKDSLLRDTVSLGNGT